jgi:hypothetical protein
MDSPAVSTSVLKDKTSEYKWSGNSFSYQNFIYVHTNNTASVAGSRLGILRDYFGHTDSYSIFVDIGNKSHVGRTV